MTTDDVTVSVLTEIRDEVRATRMELGARIEQTSDRIEQTNHRLAGVLEQTNDRLAQTNHRLTQMDVRLSTELAEVTLGVREVVALMTERRDDLRPRVERCEREIDALKTRVR